MRKYIIYTGILGVGLLMGWLFFGSSSKNKTTHNHTKVTESNQQWTCSMHPQIMQPESGTCPICGMDLIPAETSADGLAANQFKMTKNAVALANIQTSVVGTNAIAGNKLKLSGKIVENVDKTATRPAHFNGRIEKMFITSLGESVNKGQAIAVIYSPELVNAQKELLIAYKLKQTQPKLYEAVRNKFKNWKINGAQLAEVERTGKVKTKFTIYAHVSGVVTEISVNEGAHVMEGNPIFKVSDLSSVWAEFDLYEKQITAVNVGDEIRITANAIPAEAINAKISFINPVMNTATRTVIARAVLKNTNKALKPGMFVNGVLESSMHSPQENNIVLIPKTGVLWTGERSVIYIVKEESVFEMREVVLGNEVGATYEVLSGLDAGDEIVTNGAFTVDAAAQLRGKKSMMNRDSKNKEPKKDASQELKRIKVAKEFKNQLANVFENYLVLKNDLVNDNSAKSSAEMFASSVSKVDMKLLTNNNAHKEWRSIEKQLNKAIKSIASTDDIDMQRKVFKTLSENMLKGIQLFGVHKKVYIQFCPMADNDKGAFWASTEKEIRNPYFGSSMLQCGTIEKEVAK